MQIAAGRSTGQHPGATVEHPLLADPAPADQAPAEPAAVSPVVPPVRPLAPRQAPAAETAREPSPRDRVFAAVLEHGPVSAASLATRLGVTPAAVRRHLEALVEDGLLEPRTAPTTGRRGRPARVFVATERGQGAGRGDYDALAVSALDFLRETAGEQAVQEFAERRFGELALRYAPAVEAAGPDPRDRAKELARQLSADGFAASARTVAVSPLARPGSGAPVGGVQLCQGHCPVHAVAARFPQLCDAETRVFSQLLGVHVQRLATIAHGEHVCTTFVPTPNVRKDPS